MIFGLLTRLQRKVAKNGRKWQGFEFQVTALILCKPLPAKDLLAFSASVLDQTSDTGENIIHPASACADPEPNLAKEWR
jgi:hypothetical protein